MTVARKREGEAMTSDGEWAVILGVTGGTGGAVARALARSPGLNVFGMHRGHYPEQAEAVARDVQGAGRRCHLVQSGAATPEEVRRGTEELATVAGPRSVRVLVHAIANASYGHFFAPGRKRFEPAHFRKTFEAMSDSFVYWTQALLDRDLLADGARLIAFSNPMVDSVVTGWGLVSAAKAALEQYVRHLGHEIGPMGYRVMMLKFGLVDTVAVQRAFEPGEWARVRREIAAGTPARRLSTVEEVARVVSFLAGPEGEWFHAATIDLTGGQTGALLDGIFNPRRLDEPG